MNLRKSLSFGWSFNDRDSFLAGRVLLFSKIHISNLFFLNATKAIIHFFYPIKEFSSK